MIIQRDQARDIRAKYRWRQGVTPQEPRAPRYCDQRRAATVTEKTIV
jgi:hypothetical protein